MCGLPKLANKDLDIGTIKKIFSSGFALRIELSLKKDDKKHPEEIIDENKKQIISTLRLLEPGNPVINITFTGHKGFRGPILRGSMSCGYTYPLIPEMNENEKYHFSKENKEYKSLWKNLQLISLHENQRGIDIGIRKFNDIYTRKFLEDKILDMATLLESTLLYGQEDELTFRLSLRMTHLLKSIRNPNEIYKLIKGFYSVRSKISHEGIRFNDKDRKKLKKIKDNMPVKFRNPYDPNRFAIEMENICRLVIKVLINEMIEKGISIENINNRLENYSICCKEE